MLTIGIIIIIAAAVALFMPTKLGIIAKGFYGLFVKNIAQTPEGAAAIYEEAIDKAQDRYNGASDALQKIAGQCDTAKRKLAESQAKIKDVELKAEKLAQAEQFEKVGLLSEERSGLLAEAANFEQAVKELEPVLQEAKQLAVMTEKELLKLKNEKTTVVENLKRNIQLKEMYDRMDELKRNSNLDKLVGAVREGNQEKREMAVGARSVHENKLSTKLEKINNEANSLASNEYVEQLRQKYAKQGSTKK